jgi:serine phosphatase RsbU (regulator of sigma subunit)
MRLLLSLIFIICGVYSFGQDTLHILDGEYDQLFNQSITDRFTIYESEEEVSYDYFLNHKDEFKKTELSGPIANLDFTSSTYYIHFVFKNQTAFHFPMKLETARPITNEVSLFYVGQKLESRSGDEIPFKEKIIKTNRSILPLFSQANSTNEYVLKLRSDGEIISLPIIFWKDRTYTNSERKYQFSMGIYYGIFVFVILIYLTFYIQLRDPLFLLYSFYVLFSGLLQFGLDGYMHQYVFPDGGYLTQHSIIIVSGFTVFFVLNYASRYLELEGRLKAITTYFSWTVLATVGLSLIPGKLYETCYPLINGFSLLAIIYLIIVATRVRRTNKSISLLFFIGLITLFVGAIIFILGNFSVIDNPTLTQNSLKVSTLIEIICLSILMAGKYRKLQNEKEEVQRKLLVELEEKNKIVSEANIRLEQEVVERTREIEEQRILLKEKNEDFIASITYAERIQSALLSNEEKFKSILPESFVFFKPKDIVSGDFYWIERIEPTPSWPDGLIVYATADCTGHGVPGAFVSIVCNNLLKLGKSHPEVQSPGQALDFVNREINDLLNSNYNDEQIRDGMDVSLCALDLHNKEMHFAGAKNSAYIVRGKEVLTVKADRKAIGYSEIEDFTFTTQTIKLEQDDMIYTLSDGYVDQFGGEEQKKFMIKRFKQMALDMADRSMNEQQRVVEGTFEEWLGQGEQIDDVLVVGVRIQ